VAESLAKPQISSLLGWQLSSNQELFKGYLKVSLPRHYSAVLR
jgi:hypothetical protein